MGGRGSKGHGKPIEIRDPILPPDATFTPDEPPTKPPAGPPTPPAVDAPVEEWKRHINAVYDHLDPTGGYVTLTDIRPLLGDAPRELQDQILRQLSRSQEFAIFPISNLKALSQADHDAAIHIGGQPNHWMRRWIHPSDTT